MVNAHIPSFHYLQHQCTRRGKSLFLQKHDNLFHLLEQEKPNHMKINDMFANPMRYNDFSTMVNYNAENLFIIFSGD